MAFLVSLEVTQPKFGIKISLSWPNSNVRKIIAFSRSCIFRVRSVGSARSGLRSDSGPQCSGTLVLGSSVPVLACHLSAS